jgi:hypothetical protein
VCKEEIRPQQSGKQEKKILQSNRQMVAALRRALPGGTN